MTRISAKNAHTAARNLADTLGRLGVIPADAEILVHEGSGSYARSWEITYYADNGEWPILPAVDLHGAFTASQAHERLSSALYALHAVEASKHVSTTERAYLARCIDLGRSDDRARALLSPVERDELLKKFGGRQD